MTDNKVDQQKLHGIVHTQPMAINTQKAEENKDEAASSVSPIRERPDMRSWKPRRPSETIHADAGSRLFHLRRLSDA